MENQLFVGGISWDTTEDGLKAFFEGAGPVEKVNSVLDRETNRSRGFGFVTMTTEEDAQKAIQDLNGQDLDGRSLRINKAIKSSF